MTDTDKFFLAQVGLILVVSTAIASFVSYVRGTPATNIEEVCVCE